MQGRTWHSAVELNYSQKVTSEKDLPVAEVREFFANRFDIATNSEDIQYKEGETPAKLKDQGIKITVCHHETVAPKVQPKLVEQRFDVSLGEGFPFTLMGFFDLITAGDWIVDNKARGKTQSQTDIDKDIQMTAYALAYRLEYGENEKGIQMHCLIKRKDPYVQLIDTVRTDEDCRWFLRLVEQVAEGIEKESFYPNPNGWHCSPKFCGYWDICKKERS